MSLAPLYMVYTVQVPSMPEICTNIPSIGYSVSGLCVRMYIDVAVSSHSDTIHLIHIFLRNDLGIFFAVALPANQSRRLSFLIYNVSRARIGMRDAEQSAFIT